MTSQHEAAHAIVAQALGLQVKAVALESARVGFTEHVDVLDRVGVAVELYKLHLGAPRKVRLRLRRVVRLLLGRRLFGKLRRWAVVAVASGIAEAELLGGASRGIDDDTDTVVAIAELLGFHGRAINRFWDACDRKAQRILNERKDVVRTVAALLLRREHRWRWHVLEGRELQRIARVVRRPRASRTRAS